MTTPEQLTAITPAGQGTVDVHLMTANGGDVLAGGFTYVNPPTITSVIPIKGSVAGGETLTVDGSDFVEGETTVRFGGSASNAVEVESSSRLAAVVPAYEAGLVDIVVETPGGSATAPAAYQYLAIPTVAGLHPLEGFPGTDVTITGTGFDMDPGATYVAFNGVAATVLSVSPSQVVARVPDVATTGAVSVTTAGGTTTSASPFTVITNVSISVTPETATLNVGGTVQLQATVLRSNGSTASVTGSVAWSAATPSVATVNASGVVSAIAAGSTTITATLAQLTDSAAITVQSAVPLPPDPATTATPIDPTVVSDMSKSVHFSIPG